MPGFQGTSHLDLTVSDVEASADWYARVLGLRRLKRAECADRIMIVLRHEATGLIIGLNQHADSHAGAFDERRPGLDHVGLTVADRAELDSWERHLTEHGVDHSPVTDAASGAGTALVFRDPDNIQLEFWWSRPA
ncbi:VOC family protein [Pseudactinotalea sp. HY158]|uniref:VOC family protein n=1 Tax=Pseudactinotalea sp. HY158 TaxID=2654547 RepID=UPI00129D02CC|nr:VOC family protein [Pseudactinotalea sp. HY158]QGH68122.1 glyoxalase [Pseudactinotalea sp. HY158]